MKVVSDYCVSAYRNNQGCPAIANSHQTTLEGGMSESAGWVEDGMMQEKGFLSITKVKSLHMHT
jgi:hypothetical protein